MKNLISKSKDKEKEKNDKRPDKVIGRGYFEGVDFNMVDSDDEAVLGVDNSLAIVPVDRNNDNSPLSSEEIEKMQNGNKKLMGVFSTAKPKHAGAGFASGCKSVGKGVAFGVASLFAGPFVGAKEGGAKGALTGTAAGVCSAVVLPVTGVGVGVMQATRGMINTPSSIRNNQLGKYWDARTRQWKECYSLDDEAKDIFEISALYDIPKLKKEAKIKSSKNCDRKENGAVVDTYYYDVLDVPIDATQKQIRGQYYKLARDNHPDKNLDDENAKEKFQMISEAYQILGDEERRMEYDTHGRDAAIDMSIVDGMEFFMLLFGCQELEPFVGAMKLTTYEEIEQLGLDNDVSHTMTSILQRKRELDIALRLRERVCAYETAMDTSVDEQSLWEGQFYTDIIKLCVNAYTEALVDAVGWTYENVGTEKLAKLKSGGMGGHNSRMKARNRQTAHQYRAFKNAVKTISATKKFKQNQIKQLKKQQKENKVPEALGMDAKWSNDQAEFEKEQLPIVLDTVLNMCLMDVEKTVKIASKKVLLDHERYMSKDEKRKRAQLLINIGRLMQKAAKTLNEQRDNEHFDAFEYIHEYLIRRAQQQDEHHDDHHKHESEPMSSP